MLVRGSLERWVLKGMKRNCERPATKLTAIAFALTLLGSFLTDAYDGDIRYHTEVSARLAHDLRQGVHARKEGNGILTKPGLERALSCRFCAC